MRRVRIPVVMIIVLGLFCPIVPGALQTSEQGQGGHITLSGVTLDSVVQFISRIKGKPVLLPDRFPGDAPVDIVSAPTATIAPEKIMSILSVILRGAGYVIEETDDYIRIVLEKDARAVPVHEGGEVADDGLLIITMDVMNAAASDLAPILERLSSTAGSLTADKKLNKLIIKDYGANRRAILALLEILDQPEITSIERTYGLEHTSADSIVRLVKAIVTNLKQSAGPVGKKRLDTFSVEVYRPTNSLILWGHPVDVERVVGYIRKFDVKPDKAARTFHIYPVRNRDVTELKKLLDDLLKAAGDEKTGGPSMEGPRPTIFADETNSELTIMTSQYRYDEIRPWLEALDKEKAQVLIEAAYVEVSTEKLRDIGVELASADAPGENARAFWASSFGLSSVTADGRVPVLPPSGGLTIGAFRESAFNIPFLLRLSERYDDVQYVAMPSITTIDNKEATVTLSERREYETSVISAEGATREVSRGSFNEAKIELKITPHVKEGVVRLEINTTIEQFLSSSGDLANISTRVVDTEVNVPGDSMAVIAGLTRTVETETIRKAPILGDIPLIRFFFRRKESGSEQRHLCIFITPRVLPTSADLVAETQRRKEELEKHVKPGIMGTTEKGKDTAGTSEQE